MPLQDDYRVSLDTFHGPLDLLLYLIRRAEVDVNDIEIAKVTDQYMAFLEHIDQIDVDIAGEFLVMASTLIEIKSRSLVPEEKTAADGSAKADDEAGDPRYELVQQLLAYQKFRMAADAIEDRRMEFLNRFSVRPMKDKRRREQAEPVELELDDVHALDLSEAYERIMAAIDFSRLGDHRVEMDDTPIELHEEDLLDRLSRAGEGRLALQDAFTGKSGGERVGLFLATLELTRMRRVTVVQDDIDDPIVLILNDDPDDALVIETDAINRTAVTERTPETAASDEPAESSPVE